MFFASVKKKRRSSEFILKNTIARLIKTFT